MGPTTRLTVEQGTLDLDTHTLGLTGHYSNATERAVLKICLNSDQPRIQVTGAASKVYTQGIMEVSLAKGYDPDPDAKIAIVTSLNNVVTNAPFAPFTFRGDGMMGTLLYNDGGKNVVLTNIRRIVGTIITFH